ncbi:MAG: hypothetical protein ABJN75_06730 [Hoeflea sp.]|uniref:hypothetical protein n=1 Tax=Hoeflea sp. TaxID=1940281 RepID=UPI003296E7D3
MPTGLSALRLGLHKIDVAIVPRPSTKQSEPMPSILANSYQVSAMVPSLMPLPRTDTDAKLPDAKTSTTRTQTATASDTARVASDRVTAFLAMEQTESTGPARPDGPPPPPPTNGGAGPSGGAGKQSAAIEEDEISLLLLEDADTEETDETTDDTESQAITLLIDDATVYQPSSLY